MKRVEKNNPGWEYYDSRFKTVESRGKAYKLEQMMIDKNGGARSTRNFNKNNSPGKKLLKGILKIL